MATCRLGFILSVLLVLGRKNKAMPKIKTLEEHLKDLELTFKEKGYVFKGQAGPWQGCRTHLTVSCPQHGDWDTGTINRFKSGQGCPKCKASAASKSDLQHLEDILNTGKFPAGAKIYSKNVKGANWTALWFYVCPVCSLDEYTTNNLCSGVFETTLARLKKGSVPCRCSDKFNYTVEQWYYRVNKACDKMGYTLVSWLGNPSTKASICYKCPDHGEQKCEVGHFLRGVGCPECKNKKQDHLYVNVVLDDAVPVAIKVGIAQNSDYRLYRQNSTNKLKMQRLFLYRFDKVKDCRAAENTIKSLFKANFLSQSDLQDGYTETFSIVDLEAILHYIETLPCEKV